MSNLRNGLRHVDLFFFTSMGSMSHMSSGHVALSNLRVKGYSFIYFHSSLFFHVVFPLYFPFAPRTWLLCPTHISQSSIMFLRGVAMEVLVPLAVALGELLWWSFSCQMSVRGKQQTAVLCLGQLRTWRHDRCGLREPASGGNGVSVGAGGPPSELWSRGRAGSQSRDQVSQSRETLSKPAPPIGLHLTSTQQGPIGGAGFDNVSRLWETWSLDWLPPRLLYMPLPKPSQRTPIDFDQMPVCLKYSVDY